VWQITNPAGLRYEWSGLTFVKVSNYRIPSGDGYNYNGDHLMRGTNIEFTIRVIPYAP